MNRVERIHLLGVLSCLMLIGADAARPRARETLDNLRKQARDAYQKKDYPTARDLFTKVRDFLNGGPRPTYNLASVEAAMGNKDQALAWLNTLVQMGQVVDVQGDANFKAFAGDPKFKELASAMRENEGTANRSRVAFTISDPDLLTEDIAYDPATGDFYLSSVRGHKVIRINASGGVSDFASSEDSVFAVAIDPQRKLLWATTAALKGYAFAPEKDWGKSDLRKYDLQSGRLLARFSPPDDGQAHAMGDLTIAANGDLVVSDGQSGNVYLLKTGSNQLESLSDEFISPQTPAMHPDGRHVFVPDYLRGVGVLNLQSGSVVWLRHPDNIALSGIDGLYFHQGRLLAVQNGTTPERVVQIFLNPALHAVTGLEIIQANTKNFGDPTHGIVVGNDFYYITNSGWDAFDDNGHLKTGKSLSSPVVMKFSLAH